MGENVGTITIGVAADISQLGPQLGRIGGSVGGTLKNIVSSAFSFALGQGFFSFIQNGFKNGIGAAMNFDSQMQQNQISFTTMLGSASKAKQFMGWAQQFAAKTPFTMDDVVTGSKRLLAFGFSAKQIPKMLTSIGDASSAMGMSGSEGIGRISTALGQMAAHGTVDAQDMMQLTSVGIPAWDILAKAMHKSTKEVMDLSQKGMIPANVAVNDIVNGMEQRFPHMMDAQSKSYSGLMSTLKDNVVSTLGNIIKPKFEEISNKIIPHLISVTGTVSSTFNRTHSVIQALGAGIRAEFGPAAAGIFEGLATSVKDVFGWLIDHHTGVEAALAGIAGGIAAFKIGGTLGKIAGAIKEFKGGIKGAKDATGTFAKLGKAVTNLRKAKPDQTFNVLKDSIKNLTNLDPKLVLISLALAALAFVIIKNWGPISGFFKKLWAGMKSGATTALNAVKGAFTGALNGIKSVWGGITGFFSGIWSGIRSAATAAWNAIRSAVMAIVTPFAAAIQGPFNTLKSGLSNILNGIKSIFSGV